MAFEIDTSTEFGERVVWRLGEEEVAWLTTVSPSGAPVPSPVWFWWDGQSILVYSEPDRPKLRNIAQNPRVALHLNSVGGGNVIILNGTAAIVDGPPATDVPDYLAKYARFIERNGWTPQSFSDDYSVAVRITPTRLRGH
jgi:PPOX class probable F420-dependent enzyme